MHSFSLNPDCFHCYFLCGKQWCITLWLCIGPLTLCMDSMVWTKAQILTSTKYTSNFCTNVLCHKRMLLIFQPYTKQAWCQTSPWEFTIFSWGSNPSPQRVHAIFSRDIRKFASQSLHHAKKRRKISKMSCRSTVHITTLQNLVQEILLQQQHECNDFTFMVLWFLWKLLQLCLWTRHVLISRRVLPELLHKNYDTRDTLNDTTEVLTAIHSQSQVKNASCK